MKSYYMFKRITGLFLVPCSLMLLSFFMQKDNTLTEAEKKAGWKLLFDGKTLNGWRPYKSQAADCWGVKDGEIYCKENQPGGKRADLVTNEQYENYELSFDWRIARGGNSGLIYHVTENASASYLSGPEYQLIDDQGYSHPLAESQRSGSDYDMYSPTANATKPAGRYNTSKIIVKGAHREHWLNGVKVVELEAWSDDWKKRKAASKWKDLPEWGMSKKGHICLQDHGGGVWFKNIKIRPIDVKGK